MKEGMFCFVRRNILQNRIKVQMSPGLPICLKVIFSINFVESCNIWGTPNSKNKGTRERGLVGYRTPPGFRGGGSHML